MIQNLVVLSAEDLKYVEADDLAGLLKPIKKKKKKLWSIISYKSIKVCKYNNKLEDLTNIQFHIKYTLIISIYVCLFYIGLP